MALIRVCVVLNYSQRLSQPILWIVTVCATYWAHTTAVCVLMVALRWHRTVHVWLHHKNFNAYFSKSIINSLFKGVCIYKVLVYLSSSANQIVQLCVKRKLEILGV